MRIKYRIIQLNNQWYAQDVETGKIIKELFY